MGIHHFWREDPPNNGTGLLILGSRHVKEMASNEKGNWMEWASRFVASFPLILSFMTLLSFQVQPEGGAMEIIKEWTVFSFYSGRPRQFHLIPMSR